MRAGRSLAWFRRQPIRAGKVGQQFMGVDLGLVVEVDGGTILILLPYWGIGQPKCSDRR